MIESDLELLSSTELKRKAARLRAEAAVEFDAGRPTSELLAAAADCDRRAWLIDRPPADDEYGPRPPYPARWLSVIEDYAARDAAGRDGRRSRLIS
jgi:hypothetical protein